MKLKSRVGIRLKELRQKKKLTQKVLSENTGLERTFISHIEKGDRNVSIETIGKIVSGLGVSVKSFFNSEHFK